MQAEAADKSTGERPQASRFARPVLAHVTRNVRLYWPEWIAVSTFAFVLAFAIPGHQPWADEAQAWQIARSTSLIDLFSTYIRYEVTPGLWHFLLWVLNASGFSYTALHWICGAFALLATIILVFRSPFPRYLKLALPFSYFLIFQFAVIARSYVLAPLLLFLIALCWKRSSFTMLLLLGLLANISLHAWAISLGLAIVYFAERRHYSAEQNSSGRNKILLYAMILGSIYAFAIWTAWPPHDLDLARFRGPARTPLIMVFYACRSLFWGICEPWILSIPFWIAIGACLWARRCVHFLLPVLFFAAFSGVAHVAFWHMGMLAVLVVTLLWITWPEGNRSRSLMEKLGIAALTVMASIQIVWGVFALSYGRTHAYSGDLAAAEFLKPKVEHGAEIAVTYIDHAEDQDFDAVGILPSFSRNIFENWEKPFWWWSDANQAEERFASLLPDRPQIIIVETRQNGPDLPIHLSHPKIVFLTRAGYRLTHTFCGTMPERLELWRTSCHLIFESEDLPADPSSHRIPIDYAAYPLGK